MKIKIILAMLAGVLMMNAQAFAGVIFVNYDGKCFIQWDLGPDHTKSVKIHDGNCINSATTARTINTDGSYCPYGLPTGGRYVYPDAFINSENACAHYYGSMQ